jgi:hypothetical protein
VLDPVATGNHRNPAIEVVKIHYEPFKGRVLFHTKYSQYFKQNLHMFDALDFLADLTRYIRPKGLQLIRHYGLYASRTKGRWEDMPWVAERALDGWKATHRSSAGDDHLGFEPLSDEDEEVGADMELIAVIEDPDQLKRILRHLIKIGRSPPGFDPDRLNSQFPPLRPSGDVCPFRVRIGSSTARIRHIRA